MDAFHHLKIEQKLKIFKLKRSKSDCVFEALDRIATSAKKVQAELVRQTSFRISKNLQSCYK